MIDLRNLSISFLKKDLFKDVNLRLTPHRRYGVVGANGSGKSTLLKIIVGELEADSGEVAIDAGLSVFRIGQDFNLDGDQLIVDTAMMGCPEIYQALLKAEKAQNEERELIDEELISNKEAYRLKPNSQKILAGLGIETDLHHQPLKILSGGYQWRCFLAQALVKSPDILLLDEPTNHLDIISISWLEQFLVNYPGLIMLVSHDKRFLNNVSTNILDIDFGIIREYVGNYQQYEKSRQLFLLQKEKEILAQRKEIEKRLEFVERFRAKASKARQAQSRLKQIERIEITEPIISSRIHPKFVFNIIEPGSKEVLIVKNISKYFGNKLIFQDINFSIQRKEKLAIIGKNGTGKSTLLKALAGEYPECLPKIKWGMGVNIGYFPQDAGKIIKSSDLNLLEWLWQFCPEEPQTYVQSMLGRMLFSGLDVKKSVQNLSGGELARLYLAKIMIGKPNMLLLDEPTNHLDIESIDSLENALLDFPGTMIAVSHDRDFLSKIFTRLISLEDAGALEFLGNYEEFVKHKERDYLNADSEKKLYKEEHKKNQPISSNYEANKKKKSVLQKLNRDLEKIMLNCEDLEQKISQIDHEFLQDNFYEKNSYEQVNQLHKEKGNLETKLADLLAVWENIEKEISNLDDL